MTDTVNEWYTNYFAKEGMIVLPKEQTEDALTKAGYVVDDQMIPDKDMAYFSSKVSTTAKLKYHFYNTATSKMTAFQTTAVNNNKAVMVGMRSYKGSITAALQEALEKGNDRIKGLL